MGRAWRIEYEGAIYHLMSRGNQKQAIFYDDNDYQMMVNCLGQLSERFDTDIFAYVLMGNHYHLLVRTNLANLKQAMHWFGTTYTNRFNSRHSRSGHLFQGRYKSIIVENEAYLLQLSYYIHRNPLRANLVKRLSEYRWSSYNYYAYGKKQPEWLSMDLILSQHQSSDSPHKSYRTKVQNYAKEEQLLWEDFRHGLVLGSKKFVDKIRRKYLPENPQVDLPQQFSLSRSIDANSFLNEAGRFIGFDPDCVLNKRRLSGSDKDKRDLLIYFLYRSGKITNAQIGQLFSISYSAVNHSIKSLKAKLKTNYDLAKKMSDLNSQFKL